MPGSSPGMTGCRHSGAMPTGPRDARPDDRLSIEPGISRFRVRVFDAPRNDGGDSHPSFQRVADFVQPLWILDRRRPRPWLAVGDLLDGAAEGSARGPRPPPRPR